MSLVCVDHVIARRAGPAPPSRGLAVCLFVAVVLLSALPAISQQGDAPGTGKLDKPLAVKLAKRDGSQLAGQITFHDGAGFVLKNEAGRDERVKWTDLPAKDVFAVHEQILTEATAQDWLDLGRLLSSLPDGARYADVALRLARELAPGDADSSQPSTRPATLPADANGPATRFAKIHIQAPKEIGKRIRAFVRDKQGNILVASETAGIYRYNPKADGNQWVRFGARQGLAENRVYAIALDKLGRVWVGHAYHGVSVYNGKEWRNYDVPDGPLGERAYSIAVCPADGDVWIATSAGLTRYSVDHDVWRHYTVADGLASNEMKSVAFDKAGNIYAATACDGLQKADRADDYRGWVRTCGPERMPVTPEGDGLPTNLINDILVASDGTVWVATNFGLAWSRDEGNSWQYVRGVNYVDKVKKSFGGPPAGWTPPSNSVLATLLPEDYVTCLAEDDFGAILLGFHRRGVAVVDPRTARPLRQRLMPPAARAIYQPLAAEYVTSILPMPDSRPLLGGYTEGVFWPKEPMTLAASALAPTANPTGTVRVAPPAAKTPAGKASAAQPPAFPSPAKPPTLAELNAMLQELWNVKPQPADEPSPVAALPDDWRTGGDWLGRYGRYWACLCAICSPYDYFWGAGREQVPYASRIGLNCFKGDSIRFWIGALYTDGSRCLEMPPVYFDSRKVIGLGHLPRRSAACDDHGENYDWNVDGPNLYFSLKVPKGVFCLSLYGSCGYRDHRISIRRNPAGAAPGNIDGFESWQQLAHTRMHDFAGGMYKRFVVQGPIDITIQVERSHTKNTMVSAVMLDLLEEYPPPYHRSDGQWESLCSRRAQEREAWVKGWADPGTRAKFTPAKSESEAAYAVFEQIENTRNFNPVWWAANSRRYYSPLLRWYIRQSEKRGATRLDNALLLRLATCRYQLAFYDAWDGFQGQMGLTTARQIEKALKWDGKTADCSGSGLQIVMKYMAEHGLPAALPRN